MDYKKLFGELNKRLATKERYLTIICGGGFVLMINNIRATLDIDAFFEKDSWITEQIKAIGEEYQANTGDELWLNSSIEIFNQQPPQEALKLFIKLSNLTVSVVTLEYLLGMKLFSAREKDIADAGEILKKLSIKDPIFVLKKYSDFDVDPSNVLWAFELAYNEEWISEYMITNREQLQKYFR